MCLQTWARTHVQTVTVRRTVCGLKPPASSCRSAPRVTPGITIQSLGKDHTCTLQNYAADVRADSEAPRMAHRDCGTHWHNDSPFLHRQCQCHRDSVPVPRCASASASGASHPPHSRVYDASQVLDLQRCDRQQHHRLQHGAPRDAAAGALLNCGACIRCAPS